MATTANTSPCNLNAPVLAYGLRQAFHCLHLTANMHVFINAHVPTDKRSVLGNRRQSIGSKKGIAVTGLAALQPHA